VVKADSMGGHVSTAEPPGRAGVDDVCLVLLRQKMFWEILYFSVLSREIPPQHHESF
jgi:hypothetical protein